MKKQISLVKKFHEKFKVLISNNSSLISKDIYINRHKLIKDKIEAIFNKVHISNISKYYHEYKMVKIPNYFKAYIKTFL